MSKTKVIDVRVRTSDDSTPFTSILLEQYKMREFSFTLSAEGWVGDQAPYTQTVHAGVEGMTETMSGTLGVSQTASSAAYNAAARGQLRCTGKSNTNGGEVIITAYGVKPTVAIPCKIIGAYEKLSDD